MSVTVYKALKHRILAGKKIFQNNTWKTIPANARMWLNGAWHKIGFSGSQNSAVIPTPPAIPDVPAQSLTHENGTEPSTGTKWYITPAGRGSMDGSSWANAASGSMIHVIMLQVSSGDSVYFAEGDYTTDRTITLPAGVNLYGGFEADAETWSTRNGFTRQTVFTGDNTFGWMDGSAATSGQIVDGFAVKNYSGTITGSNVTLRNSVVTQGTASIPTAYNCIFTSANVTARQISYCNIFSGNLLVSTSSIIIGHVNIYGSSEAVLTATLGLASVSNCLFYYCSLTAKSASYCDVYYGSSCNISTSADHVNVYGTESDTVRTYLSNPQYCKGINCTHYYYVTSSSSSYIFGSGATNCSAINCSGSSSGYSFIFGSGATNCSAINCSGSSSGYSHIFDSRATNCSAINCSGSSSGVLMDLAQHIYIFGGNANNCTAINCCCSSSEGARREISIFGPGTTNCSAINCYCSGTGVNNITYPNKVYIFGSGVTNCSAINCYCNGPDKKESTIYCSIFYSGAISCTAVNCSGSQDVFGKYIFGNAAKNCISWNNHYTDFSDYSQAITSAGSTYNAALALTLGNDNSIARFTNTGYYPAQGVQDVGDCPSPIDDPTGYAAYIAAFGDWHPAANSFLIGRGTADSSVTTDADGVTRPDPPTIGAYEPVPVSNS